MRKLILVVALIFSSVVVGQSMPQTLDSLYNNIVDLVLADNKLMVKDGDYDAPKCIGLLQHVFSDDFTKYKYEEINPKIGQLIVFSSPLKEDITFANFIELYFGRSNFLKHYDTTKYEINYGTIPGDINMSEFIEVVNKQSGIAEFQFVIQYDRLENLASDKYLNLGSFTVIFIE
tara:strand:- start:149 stop:673 length:525 start_codon:yes stop_codon:yes gene_type:complete